MENNRHGRCVSGTGVEMRLYLDDVRVPMTDHKWQIVRSYGQAVDWLDAHSCPKYVSFDHDLGEEKSGLDVAKYIVKKDMDLNGMYMPLDFVFNVHSANPVGVKNITEYLNSYINFKIKHGSLDE